MIYGYARVSTKGQAKDGNGLDVQKAALEAAGAEEIYEEAFTGTKKDRPVLNKPKFPGVISNYISVIYDKNGSKP